MLSFLFVINMYDGVHRSVSTQEKVSEDKLAPHPRLYLKIYRKVIMFVMGVIPKGKNILDLSFLKSLYPKWGLLLPKHSVTHLKLYFLNEENYHNIRFVLHMSIYSVNIFFRRSAGQATKGRNVKIFFGILNISIISLFLDRFQ